MLQARVGRRSVLTAGTGLAGLSTLAALSGCTAAVKPRPARTPQPDDLAVSRAIVQAQGLRASALARAGAGGSRGGPTAKILESAAGDHTAHLAALGAPVPGPSASVSATSSSETSSSPTGSSAEPGEPGDQVTAEWTGAREALRDAIGAESAGLAALLTRIAATRAVHADLLVSALNRKRLPDLPPAEALTTTPAASETSETSASSVISASAASPAPSATASATAPSTPSDTPESTPDSTTPDSTASPTALSAPPTPWLKVLDRLLAGEHAAVFAYPLVIAQLSGRDRDRATDLWAAHQAERNDLSAILVTGGALPTAAAAAYRVTRPASAGAARRLAASVELGLAALAGDVVAVASSAGQRTFGADNLVLSARRSAGWSGQSTALPGLPATPPATTPSMPAPGTPAPSIT